MRSNKLTLSLFSRRLMVLLTEEGVRSSFLAAAEKLPSCKTHKNTCMSSSIPIIDSCFATECYLMPDVSIRNQCINKKTSEPKLGGKNNRGSCIGYIVEC